MDKNWPTKDKDMLIAQLIMEEYADKQNSESLGLLELVVDREEKRMNFRLSNWILVLAQQFNSMYGIHQGEYVIRQIISGCIIKDQTLH